LGSEEISWNLGEIFPSTVDRSVQIAIDETLKTADLLTSRYRGRLAGISPGELTVGLGEFEAFQAKLYDLVLYATLSYQVNMTDPSAQSLHDKVSKLQAKLDQQLAFAELELGSRISQDPLLVSEPSVANYAHYLEKLGRKAPHLLTEAEEKLVIAKDQFGVKAWEELQNKWLNTRLFEVEVEGTKKSLTYGEANGLLHHHDRATRESANRSIYGVLGKSGEVFSFALRNICNDWVSICETRKYDSPMHPSLIANDSEQGIIDGMLEAVGRQVGLYQRYLRLKAKLMGLAKLGDPGLPQVRRGLRLRGQRHVRPAPHRCDAQIWKDQRGLLRELVQRKISVHPVELQWASVRRLHPWP
jgi:oligoendopeptidase F